MMRRMLSICVVAAVLLSAGVASRAAALDGQRAEALAEVRAMSESTRTAQARTDHLQGRIDIAERTAEDLDALLSERPAFLAEIAAFRAALEGAGGKVDTAAHRASVLSAQQSVLDEREDTGVVVAATATVRALTAKLGEEVSIWQTTQYAGDGADGDGSGGSGGYARVRAALDRVGGAGVGLYESSSCAGGTAPACANSNGYIKYRGDIAQWSTERLNWAMAHELAHIYQFRVWNDLTAAEGYRSMFGGDPEFLANCMAVVRGYPGSVSCDSDQQVWASAIWVGAVR